MEKYSQPRALAVKNIVLVLAYWLAGEAGDYLGVASLERAEIWSPRGIGLAAMLLWGYGCWPGIGLGAFIAHLNSTADLPVSALLAAAKPVECFLAAWLTNRFAGGARFFEHPWNMLKFGVLAAGLCPLLSPPIGVVDPMTHEYVLWSGGAIPWFSNWLGKAASVLVLTPLIVTWSRKSNFTLDRSQRLEFALLLASLGAFGWAIFGDLLHQSARPYLLPNFCFPFLIWAAFRFGPRETATAIVVLGLISLLGTLTGHGFHARARSDQVLLVYQGFIAANSLMAMMVASVIQHRNQYRDALRQARDNLEERVRQRTDELVQANRLLETEFARRQKAQEAHAQVLRMLDEAQEIERRRLSRELHDQLGQEITAAKLALTAIRDLGPHPDALERSLDRLESLTNSLMRNVQRLAWELRPAVLDDFGLATALRRYCKEWSEHTGVAVDFDDCGTGEYRLPPNLESMLYRVAQEALTNVARHAGAARVSLQVRRQFDRFFLVVEDDGRGFNAEAVIGQAEPQNKLGLLGMQERVGLAGGTLTIESSPGQGTAIFVRVPLPAAARADNT